MIRYLRSATLCVFIGCAFMINGADKDPDPFAKKQVEDIERIEPRPSPESLKLFKEPSLVPQKDMVGLPAIRLVWIRTFHAPIAIRAYMTAKGPRLKVVKMSGKGGYDWGNIDFENDYPLSNSHWDHLKTLIKVDYARQPLKDVKPENRDMLSGLDGSSWILEVSDAEGYTSEDVSNPTTITEGKEDEKRHIDALGFHLDAFVAVCKYLIQFAPMDSETIY